MKILRHNENAGANMLTATSILQTLSATHFASYKALLSNLANFWEEHADRLPSEIGPRDVVARAASLRLIRRNADGSIDIVRPRGTTKTSRGLSKSRGVGRAIAR